MKCLHKTCPMGGRFCPAVDKCPEYRRTISLSLPRNSFNGTSYISYLSPAEAVDALLKLQNLTAHIDDLGNPPDFWPSHHDEEKQ